MRGYILRECEVCGDEFECTHGRQHICPECREAIYHNKKLTRYAIHNNPVNIEKYENEMRERYMARYKNTIVAIGYADRQIAKTLEMVGKVRTEL